jgi:hypothetical protein
MTSLSQITGAEQAHCIIMSAPGTCPATVCKDSVCQTDADAKPKRRQGSGRRALIQPTEAHSRIIELVRTHGISKTARQIGRSRQRVHQVISRWAPELKKSKLKQISEPVVKRIRPPRRNVVISFRISGDQWCRLAQVDIDTGKGRLSVYKKARAIVLNSLNPEGPRVP